MEHDPDSPRRRDVLRGSAAAGLAAFGWSFDGVSAQDRTTTEQDQRSASVFSYGLQEGDRFRVWSRLRTPEDEPATERLPSECHDQQEEFAVFVVRAYRNGIQLGYEGLFVPQGAVATATTETTTGEGETTTEEPTGETTTGQEATTGETTAEETPGANETTIPSETTTPSETTVAGNETTTPTTATATGAAIQDETTTTPPNQTAGGNATTTLANETTDGNATETTLGNRTTVGNQTETAAGNETVAGNQTATTTETTTTEAAGLPAIRVGEWYRVASMSKCNSLSRMSLESAEPPSET